MEDFAFLDETFLVDGVGDVTRPFGSNQAAEAGVSQAQGGLTWNKDYVSNATWTPPMVGSQVGRIQGFTDPFENQGSLEDEWMDLSSLLGNLEATTTDTTPALSEPVSLLGGLDTYDFFPPAPVASEMTLPKPEEPKVKPVSFLERLLRQQTNLMGQKTKIESSESLWKWLCEQKDQPERAASKESPQLLPSLQEQLVSPQSEKAAEGAEASSAPIILHSDLSADEDEGSDVDLDVLLDSDKVELVQTTPGVIDDVESPLSSAVSSPSASTTNQGAECRMLSDQHTSPGTSSSRSSSVSKRRKSRSRRQTQSVDNLPSEQDLEWMNKTDRKKFQNKIAAIRYRMKKKAESSQKKSEVDELEGINKKLQQQVEKLSKEVTYMKNFFNDVRKARGLPTINF